MADKIDELLGAHARRHDALIDSTVAQFDRGLRPILARAQAALTEELRGKLTVVDGRIIRDRATQVALRAIARRFPQIMSEEGYDAHLAKLSKDFGRQLPMFEDILDILGVPKPTWHAADKRYFADQARAGVLTLENLVQGVGFSTYRTALLQIGGLPPRRLATLIADETGKTADQASAIADTATTVYYRTIAARGYDIIEADGEALRYRFYGPRDKLNRPFCRNVIDADRSWTRADIAKMRNANGTDPFTNGGGYRCRHQWIIAVDRPATDEAPFAIARTPGDEPHAKRVQDSILSAPQEVRKLGSRVGPIHVVKADTDAVSSYNARTRTLALVDSASVPEILHEYFHHLDYGLAEGKARTVSADEGTLIGHEIRLEIERLGNLGESGRAAMRKRIRGNLYLEDLLGALTFNKVGRGHDLDYWLKDGTRRYREAFANLGTLYSTNAWSRAKGSVPELAEAFELWLDAASKLKE